MPKINGKPVDPKAYSLRITNAKKTIAKTDPAVIKKIEEMYPRFSNKEGITKKTLDRQMKKKATPSPKSKVTKKATPKPSPKKTLGPLPKNPTLNDYLIRGLKVPKAPGQKKLPSDSDVNLKKYNKKK